MDAFDRQLALRPAINWRQEQLREIRRQLVSWLRDGYETSSLLHHTKDQILVQLDDLIQRAG
jgi:hypothetical protein